MSAARPVRILVAVCPRWPVVALGYGDDEPAAVLEDCCERAGVVPPRWIDESLVDELELPDEDDRHVLAAAIAAEATT